MEETEGTPSVIVRRRGRLRKRLVSDDDSAGDIGDPDDMGTPETTTPRFPQEGGPSVPPAEGVQAPLGDENDRQGSLSDASGRTPPPQRRLRLKAKPGEVPPERNLGDAASPLSTPKSKPKQADMPSRDRSPSAATAFSSSDADEMSDDELDSSSTSSSGEEESDGDILSPLRGRQEGRSWRQLGSIGVGTDAQFQEALDWCLNRILSEGAAITTTASIEQRQYEIALWDDELTRGGTRHFADAFFCEPTRALSSQHLPATTPEEKAVVFLDYPNELYKTEFLHLRVVEPRTRRVVLANLLKCAADQQAACREFDKWLGKNKRFFITQEERLNKLFHLRVAEPRGLRKLQHLLLRAEQCGLVERSKSMGYRRAAPSLEEDEKPSGLRNCAARSAASPEFAREGTGSLDSQLLFGPEDSQYSQDGFSGDESHSRTWNESSTRGWAALKRSGASRSVLKHTEHAAALQPQTLRARAKEEQRRRQEHRDAEKKQARRAALRQRWADLQRLARSTHNGPRFHHPNREEHAKAQRFTARGFSFSRFEVVYIRPPQELHGRHREALDAYLRQLPRMHKLLAEPHKLALASKYGLVSVTESTDLASPPTLERNVDPWQHAKAAGHWDELRRIFGYAPWDLLAAGGNFIPGGLVERLREKAHTQAAAAAAANAEKNQQQTGTAPLGSRRTPSKSKTVDVATPRRAGGEVVVSPEKNTGSQHKTKDGDIFPHPRSPTKTPARQQPIDKCTTPRRTPVSASRLRRGISPPPVQQEPNAGGAECEGTSAAAKLVENVNDKEEQTQSSPLAMATPAGIQIPSPQVVHTSSGPHIQQETDTSSEAKGNASTLDAKAQQFVHHEEAEAAQSPRSATVAPEVAHSMMAQENQHRPGTSRSPMKAARGHKEKEKPPAGRRANADAPRQMKLTDLLRFTLNKVKGKVAFPINSETLRGADVDDESDEDFTTKKRNPKRRLIDDDALTVGGSISQQRENFTAPPVDLHAAPPSDEPPVVAAVSREKDPEKGSTTENSAAQPPESMDEEEAQRQEKRRQKQLRRKEHSAEAKKQRRLERKRQLQEIVRRMVEYEAEENDEELRDDAEYAAALEELKHRLAREGDDDDDDLDGSENEFLEDLIAKPEDADEDERNEDRVAMAMKLQRDLGEREEEVYERMIGRYQRSGKEAGTELTEQELMELELEERRRNEAKRRKLLGDGALAGIEIDDWLSDSDDSGADSISGEENNAEDAGEEMVRWSTIALDGAGSNAVSTASSGPATPADLAAKCQENATRRQRIQKLLEMRKKDTHNSEGMGISREQTGGTEGTRQPIREDRNSQKAQQKSKDSESEDEMESLYRSASKVQGKIINPSQRGTVLRVSSCIRFNPNHQSDLDLSRSSSHAAAPVFAGFRSGVTYKPKTSPGQSSEARAQRNSSSGFSGLLNRLVNTSVTAKKATFK